MNSTTEILKIKKGEAQKSDAGSFQTGTLLSHLVISRAVDLGFQFGLYGQKAKTYA